jgi:Ca2+:H+ antiporter
MKFLYLLLILAPITLILDFTGTGSHTLMFVMAALSLVPLAAVLGNATETVAGFTGHRIGGLLNATLGNAAELIICAVALREGLVDVVKASIAGSIIGNVLFVLGAAMLFGGLKFGTQTFNAQIASTNASTMALAVVVLLIPAIFAFGSEEHRPSADDIVNLSDGVAVVLILLYAAYLLFTIFGTKNDELLDMVEEEEAPDGGKRALWMAVGLLVGSTLAIVFLSETLVGALEPTAEAWGLSDLFIGVMLVPVVGNIAEHLVAVQVALRNKMELSIGIAVGSGLQIALFVAPVLVLLSQFVGSEPMNLVFNTFELSALFGAVLIAVLVSVDGKSHWFEGTQLLALYVILAIGFYFVP